MSARFSTRAAHAVALFFLAALVPLAGCGEDEAEGNCALGDQGNLIFQVDPVLTGTTLNFTGTLIDIQSFPSNDPPVIFYIFQNLSGQTRTIRLEDIGLDFPLTEGSIYSLRIEEDRRTPPIAVSLFITDEQGDFVYFAVNDYRPNNQLYLDGYPDIDGLELNVFFTDDGCISRFEDVGCIASIRNHRLEFVIDDGTYRRSLWNGQDAEAGPYLIHVFRSQAVVAEPGCQAENNGVSFSIERDGLR